MKFFRFQKSNLFFFKINFFLSFFIFSCGIKNDIQFDEENFYTLKKESERRSVQTVWTSELEGQVLEENIFELKNFSSSIALSPEIASLFFESEPIYPQLADFGSLDVSQISYEMKSLLEAFCSKVVKKSELQDFVDYTENLMLFSLAFFLHDIKDFEISYYVFGSPYALDNDFEIPVRFFCKNGFFDAALFVSSPNEIENESGDTVQDKMKIKQVRIIRSKFSGELK